jgi:hypothetical protein
MADNETSNDTHAEHHFVAWLRLPEQAAVRAGLTQIVLMNMPYSPCSSCGGELALLMKEFPASSRPKAMIKWTVLYDNTDKFPRVLRTTPGTITSMAVNWEIMQPSPLPVNTPVTGASGKKDTPYVIDTSNE